MPMHQYGVLKGRAIDARRDGGEDRSHYHVHIAAGAARFRISINVRSKAPPSTLLFYMDDAFQHPITRGLPDLPLAFTRLANRPGGQALDFIRGDLLERRDMRPLPADLPGPDNDLSERLALYCRRAIRERGALVYAWGERWGPERNLPDRIFGFRPGNGIHDIHMNQGNAMTFRSDDGVWQDGGLIFHFPQTRQWVAIFLAFQSQSWRTDDRTGHALR